MSVRASFGGAYRARCFWFGVAFRCPKASAVGAQRGTQRAGQPYVMGFSVVFVGARRWTRRLRVLVLVELALNSRPGVATSQGGRSLRRLIRSRRPSRFASSPPSCPPSPSCTRPLPPNHLLIIPPHHPLQIGIVRHRRRRERRPKHAFPLNRPPPTLAIRAARARRPVARAHGSKLGIPLLAHDTAASAFEFAVFPLLRAAVRVHPAEDEAGDEDEGEEACDGDAGDAAAAEFGGHAGS